MLIDTQNAVTRDGRLGLVFTPPRWKSHVLRSLESHMGIGLTVRSDFCSAPNDEVNVADSDDLAGQLEKVLDKKASGTHQRSDNEVGKMRKWVFFVI
jgi:hypothetical protein